MPKPSNIPGRDLNEGLLSSANVMSFGDHLEDLRKRVFYSIIGILPIFAIAFIFGRPLLAILIKPALLKLHEGGQPPVLQATSPFETFGTVVQIAIVVTILIGAPWLLIQLWKFVSPGLYSHERRIAYLLIPFSAILTVLSILFLYFVILPVILTFFIGFNAKVSAIDAITTAPLAEGIVLPTIPVLQSDPIDPPIGAYWINEPMMQQRVRVGTNGEGQPIIQVSQLTTQTGILQQYRISEYIKTLLNMGLAFGIAFQTPVVIVMLGWVGILNPKTMGKWRKHAIATCAVLGALLTPADPVSMVLLAVPLYLLYELGLFILRVLPIEKVVGRVKLDQDPDAITPEDPTDD